MKKLSFNKAKIHVLLLEGVHPSAVEAFRADGYENIETIDTALPNETLFEKIADAHIIGIRSRTQLTENVFSHAQKLLAVGCFCIGTNQVDLMAAQNRGIPVFNAPYANTRSVAELVLAEIIFLVRGIAEKNTLAHAGQWLKTAKHSHEIRGKQLGIIGYGHIGMQLGVLAETLGMRVIFYDIEKKLPLGNATQVASLHDLLSQADAVSLHVPDTIQTTEMINTNVLSQMKKGSVLINASRGTVVDIDALNDALTKQHIAGAAIDVFPEEPHANDEPFVSPLQGLRNVILTPHIGGSTMEAQYNIGQEVADKLIKYSDNGSTLSAVNFPEVSLPAHPGKCRLMHIHKNTPGILSQINDIFSECKINIAAQYLQTNNDIGYVVIDSDTESSKLALEKLQMIPGTIRTRLLY